MERGKERAKLRSAEMKRLIQEMENQRDTLLDEVATKQGETNAFEAIIKRVYEMILDINKDEQTQVELTLSELEREQAAKEKVQAAAKHKKENAPRKKKTDKALKGQKNSEKYKETIERARKARGKSRAKKAKESKDK